MNTPRPTPRTDAETQRLKAVLDSACTEGPWEAPICSVGVDFARQLESENEAMRAAIQEAHLVLKNVPAEYDPRFFRAGKWSESALAALKPFLPETPTK